MELDLTSLNFKQILEAGKKDQLELINNNVSELSKVVKGDFKLNSFKVKKSIILSLHITSLRDSRGRPTDGFFGLTKNDELIPLWFFQCYQHPSFKGYTPYFEELYKLFEKQDFKIMILASPGLSDKDDIKNSFGWLGRQWKNFFKGMLRLYRDHSVSSKELKKGLKELSALKKDPNKVNDVVKKISKGKEKTFYEIVLHQFLLEDEKAIELIKDKSVVKRVIELVEHVKEFFKKSGFAIVPCFELGDLKIALLERKGAFLKPKIFDLGEVKVI